MDTAVALKGIVRHFVGMMVSKHKKQRFIINQYISTILKSRQNSKKSSTQRQQSNRKKVISPNEGEYVDYEEIKD
jgi:hypothetical protein